MDQLNNFFDGQIVTFESYRDLKSYVINLEREHWRYDVARKELTGLGFSNIKRWNATDYLKEDVVTEMRKLGATRLDRFYNCAEMSCLLSHFRVMHNFLSGTDPYCLVFEDDVVAVPQFKKYRDFQDIKWGDFDLLSFGGPFAGPDYSSWTPNKNGWNSSNLEPLLEAEKRGASHISNCCFWQSHAYIISRHGAYRLLQDYPAWSSSNEYRIPFMDVYMSSNRNIQNKLIYYRPENPEQYSIGDQFGDRFCGIMFQRKDFTSTILGV
jgi:GR25 family glycosyltransferase involved in LPS biosynthesis